MSLSECIELEWMKTQHLKMSLSVEKDMRTAYGLQQIKEPATPIDVWTHAHDNNCLEYKKVCHSSPAHPEN